MDSSATKCFPIARVAGDRLKPGVKRGTSEAPGPNIVSEPQAREAGDGNPSVPQIPYIVFNAILFKKPGEFLLKRPLLLCAVFCQANLIVRHPLRGLFLVNAIRFLGFRSCLASPQALVRHPLRGLCSKPGCYFSSSCALRVLRLFVVNGILVAANGCAKGLRLAIDESVPESFMGVMH